MQKLKVENMTSPRGNKQVPNQFIITTDEGVYFQSYQSVIVFIPKNVRNGEPITLDEKYWDYSITTGKYRNQFLGETKSETLKKIKSGEYLLADLNA